MVFFHQINVYSYWSIPEGFYSNPKPLETRTFIDYSLDGYPIKFQ